MVVGTAAARPGNGAKAMQITLECDNGETYEGVVAGRGRWAPAHVNDSKTRFQPTGFLAFEGTSVDKHGASHEELIEDPIHRGNGNTPEGATIITCEFSVSWSNAKTGESLEGEGIVVGYLKQEETSEVLGAEQQQQGNGKLNNQGKGKAKGKNK